jgi:glycerol-3-phosphate dehydrogenase subunit C
MQTYTQLFELIDSSPSGEMDTVPSSSFKSVVDDCTVCDMCYLVKCPYTPPHALNIDFPHLMLRYRAVENNQTAKNQESGKELNPPLPGEDAVKMGPAAGGMSMVCVCVCSFWGAFFVCALYR